MILSFVIFVQLFFFTVVSQIHIHTIIADIIYIAKDIHELPIKIIAAKAIADAKIEIYSIIIYINL